MWRSIVIFFVILPGILGAQSYLWPTDASPYLTSSFGEYRTRHFHAGLDIKSWNTPGYKVFAIDDGYIWRVRTSNTGYGKVLYQKLPDGRIAVYAHLDRFNTELDDFIYTHQWRSGSYQTDVFPQPDQFPVKKNDVIAYTGNTGTRYPHLHFEIRSEDNEPMNPLSLGLEIEDTVAPTPQQIVITPLSGNSQVNGTPYMRIPTLRRQSGNTYRTDRVTVSGEFGLEIQAFDGVSSVYNKYSIYAAQVSWQDSVLFRFQYDTFSFSDSRLITMERNYPLKREGLGRFQRLYATDHTRQLPFYMPEKDGRITLPPGEQTVIITLRDFNGNETTVTVPVRVVPAENYRVSWYTHRDCSYCQIYPADTTFSGRASLSSLDNNLNRAIVQPDTTIFRADTLTMKLPVSAGPDTKYLLSVQGRGTEQTLLYPDTFTQDSIPGYSLDWIYTPRGMIAQVTLHQEFTNPLQLELLSNSHDTVIPFSTTNLKTWHTNPINTEDLTGQTLVLSSPTRVIQILPQNYVVTQSSREAILTNSDQTVELHVSGNTLYNQSLIWYTNQNPPNDTFYSPVWSFYPRTVPFENPAQIRVQVPDVPFPLRQLGIYYAEDDEEWNYLPAAFSADSTMLTGEILSLESFTLRRDSLAPVITGKTPRRTTVSTSPDRIEFRIRDEHSGIPGSKSIQLLVDGTPVIFEFNPITKILTYRLRQPLDDGPHTVKVAVIDAAGNRSEELYTFTVR